MPLRSPTSVLAHIDAFNSAMGDYKLRGAKVLITLAENENTDAVERRRCATALVRAPFERYPNSAAINGPESDDDDDDSDDDSDSKYDYHAENPMTPPLAHPQDLMRAYDHGYWSGFSNTPWPRPLNLAEHMTNIHACHSPGRRNPLPPPGTDPGPHTANPPPPPPPPPTPPPPFPTTYASRARQAEPSTPHPPPTPSEGVAESPAGGSRPGEVLRATDSRGSASGSVPSNAHHLGAASASERSDQPRAADVPSASPLHREAVEVSSRGLPRSGTPGDEPPQTSSSPAGLNAPTANSQASATTSAPSPGTEPPQPLPAPDDG
ncbi:MAG: hypothetical protein ACKVS8_06445 [Phycisphaerales bacterium]